jgi:LytS/YehU family sensor histidine kinase
MVDLLAYGAVTGLVHSVNFYRRLRERERRALLLESNLAHARLSTLKAQLQPHFLFNSLNAIAALLRRDPRLAETKLVALSELLRLALSQSERQEGALREELEVVQRYLEIQQTRFGDKLSVEQNIDPQALDCLVPTLVLQPLVENAIRHGIEPSEKAGVVRVSASREDGKLVLAVEDDGVGLASDSCGREDPAGPGPSLPTPARSSALGLDRRRTGTGIGLANLRERLQALYGAGQKLELTRRATGGVIVRVEIPWRSPVSSESTNSLEV